METATPGVKSTSDGWLNRYLQARRAETASSFRAVSLTGQLPRTLQGTAPAVAMSQLAQFGIRGGNDDALGASFEAQYAAAADRVLNGTGRETFEAIRTLKTADPLRYEPEHGADYPRTPFGQAPKQIAQLSKAGLRSGSGVCRTRRLGHPCEPGRSAKVSSPQGSTTLPEASRHSSQTSASAWTTPSC